MSVTVNGKHYSDSELEAMSLPELKALALAEGEQIQAQQAAEAQAADAAQHAQIKSAAQIAGEEALAERLPLPALEKIVMEQGAEAERQLRQNEIREQLAQDKLEKETEGMTLEQIREKVVEEAAKAELADSPESKTEEQLRNVNQELEDASFVRDELQRKNSKALDQIITRKINEVQSQQAAAQKMGAEFAARHPEVAWNGAAGQQNCQVLLEYLESSRQLNPSPEILESALATCRYRGLIKLVSERPEQMQELPPRRKSSSASSSHSGSMYDRPIDRFDEETAYSLPLEELRARAERQLQKDAGRGDPGTSARTVTLSRFGLPA